MEVFPRADVAWSNTCLLKLLLGVMLFFHFFYFPVFLLSPGLHVPVQKAHPTCALVNKPRVTHAAQGPELQ